MEKFKVKYPIPTNAPMEELSIEVTAEMLEFLKADNAIKLVDGHYEFTLKGQQRIKEADGD